jgi:hypothetical protein
VFVGGTGRCGTHAVAALAAASGRRALVPVELRIHTDLRALPSLASGEHGRVTATRHLLGHWRRHPAPWDPASPRGTHRAASRRRHLLGAARVLATPAAGRERRCRLYLDALLDPLGPPRRAWIEKTPDNCAAAGFLHRLYPEMRLIHVVRDGRDVACSFMRVPWAPGDFAGALALWERSLLFAHRGTTQLPADQVHRVTIEALVERDRERSYRALLAFLGDDPDQPSIRAFFDSELTPDRASIGRWRRDLPAADHPTATRLYRESLERLTGAGVHPLPPLLTEAPQPPAEPIAVSGIDPWAAITAAALRASDARS